MNLINLSVDSDTAELSFDTQSQKYFYHRQGSEEIWYNDSKCYVKRLDQRILSTPCPKIPHCFMLELQQKILVYSPQLYPTVKLHDQVYAVVFSQLVSLNKQEINDICSIPELDMYSSHFKLSVLDNKVLICNGRFLLTYDPLTKLLTNTNIPCKQIYNFCNRTLLYNVGFYLLNRNMTVTEVCGEIRGSTIACDGGLFLKLEEGQLTIIDLTSMQVFSRVPNQLKFSQQNYPQFVEFGVSGRRIQQKYLVSLLGAGTEDFISRRDEAQGRFEQALASSENAGGVGLLIGKLDNLQEQTLQSQSRQERLSQQLAAEKADQTDRIERLVQNLIAKIERVEQSNFEIQHQQAQSSENVGIIINSAVEAARDAIFTQNERENAQLHSKLDAILQFQGTQSEIFGGQIAVIDGKIEELKQQMEVKMEAKFQQLCQLNSQQGEEAKIGQQQLIQSITGVTEQLADLVERIKSDKGEQLRQVQERIGQVLEKQEQNHETLGNHSGQLAELLSKQLNIDEIIALQKEAAKDVKAQIEIFGKNLEKLEETSQTFAKVDDVVQTRQQIVQQSSAIEKIIELQQQLPKDLDMWMKAQQQSVVNELKQQAANLTQNSQKSDSAVESKIQQMIIEISQELKSNSSMLKDQLEQNQQIAAEKSDSIMKELKNKPEQSPEVSLILSTLNNQEQAVSSIVQQLQNTNNLLSTNQQDFQIQNKKLQDAVYQIDNSTKLVQSDLQDQLQQYSQHHNSFISQTVTKEIEDNMNIIFQTLKQIVFESNSSMLTTNEQLQQCLQSSVLWLQEAVKQSLTLQQSEIHSNIVDFQTQTYQLLEQFKQKSQQLNEILVGNGDNLNLLSSKIPVSLQNQFSQLQSENQQLFTASLLENRQIIDEIKQERQSFKREWEQNFGYLNNFSSLLKENFSEAMVGKLSAVASRFQSPEMDLAFKQLGELVKKVGNH